MPLVFIHGVAARQTAKYDIDVAARNELIRRFVLDPLASIDPLFKGMKICNTYWGKYGVDFRWNQASLPEVHTIEHLGAVNEDLEIADVEYVETVRLINSGIDNTPYGTIDRLGVARAPVYLRGSETLKAARVDLSRLIEGILAPITHSNWHLMDNAVEVPTLEGILQALLLVAGQDVANDQLLNDTLRKSEYTDEQILNLIQVHIQRRFEILIEENGLLETEKTEMVHDNIETLGPQSIQWVEAVKDRVAEIFARSTDSFQRVTTMPLLELFRKRMHSHASRFFGDVYEYLSRRGTSKKPGPIVRTVLEDIKSVLDRSPGEPLFVITNSMGGNIFYDIMTYYEPDLKVKFWASVAGQVGHFEEMKLFKASNLQLRTPHKVETLKPRLGKWINVYDPADSFSFRAGPIFEDAEDIVYLTGAGALASHNSYFKRASLYYLLRESITESL